MDTAALESIELFALLLARCNFSRSQALEHFRFCFDELSASVGLPSGADDDVAEDVYVPAEVLTQWHLVAQYVQKDGRPRALRANGTGFTVASLVRRVDPRADPEQILKYLLSIRAVTRVGNRYIPRDRIARHRFSPRLQRIHHFLAVLALLRTVEGNVRQDRQTRQYQFTTDGTIPENQLVDFRKDMAEVGDQTLVFADEAMFRLSTSPRRGESAIPVTLGVFMSEGRPLPSLLKKTAASAVRRGSKRKQPRGASR
jgi:hypothetical protein